MNNQINRISAYQTSDGQVFTNFTKASDHQTDIVGQMLDDLFADDPNGQFSRMVRRRILLAILDDPKLKDKIAALNSALQFGGDGDLDDGPF